MKSLSIALLLFGALAVLLGGSASAETITVPKPAHDPYNFVPGETMTITFSNMVNARVYDFKIINDTGDTVWVEYNFTSDGTNTTRAVTIPANWSGSFTVETIRNGSFFASAYGYFSVHQFYLTTQADHQVYLPGASVIVYYETQRLEDQKPQTGGHGRWRMDVQRDNGSGFVTEPLGNSFSDPAGSFSIQLPTTTRPQSYTLFVFYNNSDDTQSETDTLTIYVGTFNVVVSTDRSVYAPGDSVIVTVSARASSYTSEPTPGADVTLKIEKFDPAGGTWNEETSYGTQTHSTNVAGVVSFLVPIPSGVADDTVLRARVSAVKGGTPQEATAQFSVHSATGFSIDLKFDKDTYKPGDTAHARLVFTSTNQTLIDGSMYEWTIEDGGNHIFVKEYVAGTSTGASRDFVIPSDFTGTLYVSCTVYTPDDKSYYRSDSATVFAYALLLNPSELYFQPGDVIVVNASLVTDQVQSASFYWTVTSSVGGDPIAKGSVPDGSKSTTVQFTVPASDAADSYTVQVAAQGGGLVASSSTSVYMSKYVALQVTIPDKQFKPGDQVTLHYAFVVTGNATPPTTTTITVSVSGTAGSSRTFQVDTSRSLSGDLQYTIPATVASNADLTLTASSPGAGTTTTTVFVRPTAAGSNPISAAAGTASSALLVGVLGVILAFVAIIMMVKMRNAAMAMKGGMGGGSAPSSYDAMKPSGGSSAMPPAAGASDKKDPNEPPKSL